MDEEMTTTAFALDGYRIVHSLAVRSVVSALSFGLLVWHLAACG
jgi:hypothetical protein